MAVGAEFDGRRQEPDLATNAITGASGRSVVLIAGDPGIGKTRLLATATNSCGEVGFVVLTTWCMKQSQMLPLSPIADVLHQMAELDGGATFKAGSADCPEFIPPGADPAASGAGRTGRISDADGHRSRELRRQLFDAIRSLLSVLPGVLKCAIAIKDLHWADATTLVFLDNLFASGHVPGPSVIVTCRSRGRDAGRMAGEGGCGAAAVCVDAFRAHGLWTQASDL